MESIYIYFSGISDKDVNELSCDFCDSEAILKTVPKPEYTHEFTVIVIP